MARQPIPHVFRKTATTVPECFRFEAVGRLCSRGAIDLSFGQVEDDRGRNTNARQTYIVGRCDARRWSGTRRAQR
jgi:hypothetical protein